MTKNVPDKNLYSIELQQEDVKERRSWKAPRHEKISFWRLANFINASKRENKLAECGELLMIAKETLEPRAYRNYLDEFTFRANHRDEVNGMFDRLIAAF